MNTNPKMPPWLSELTEQVSESLEHLTASNHDRRPALQAELAGLQEKSQGWSLTLANSRLPPAIREQVETDWNAALERQHEIGAELGQLEQAGRNADKLVDADDVVSRLNRLDQVLAIHDPTRGNLELSLHIDRITCYPDHRVQLKMCKLGIMPDTIELLATSVLEPPANDEVIPTRARARRRGRLRVVEDDEQVDLRAQADFVADVDRFAGLGDEWFWFDEFTIPESLSWSQQNAEAVFQRRKETQLPYSKLAVEFGVTPPTIGAAIRVYLAGHPDEMDIVLGRGGKRKPKFDLSKFGNEARQLWLDGWSKEKLARKYGCSLPTLDKAIAFAYRQEGLTMPKRADDRAAKVVEARRLLDSDKQLEEISATMKISDVTARTYLRESFAAEGKPMPDLRRRRRA